MLSHFILYVADQLRSRQFYSDVLEQPPRLDVPGMTEFVLGDQCVLGLMPHSSIQRLLGVPSAAGSDVARAELYLLVECPDAWYARALLAGAKPLSPSQLRDWGDLVAYCADPDGHILALARTAQS